MKIKRFLNHLLAGLCLVSMAVFSTPAVLAEPSDTNPAGINDFGIDLYHALRGDDDGNLLISPFSIALALGMVLPGADDEAAQELLRALTLADVEDSNTTLGTLRKAIAARGEAEGITVDIANRGFVQQDFSLSRDYVAVLSDWFDFGMEQVNYGDPEAARERINQWVAENTNDLITDLLKQGSITELTRLTLVNAIYLLADWKHAFNEAETRDEPFHFTDGSSEPVATMNQMLNVPVSLGEGYQALELPYIGDELAMLIIVPDDLPAFEQSLSSKRLSGIIDNLHTRQVELWLPKTEARTSAGLKEPLEKIGVERLFCDHCNPLHSIAPPAELFVSGVFHDTYLRMDEQGTEAAAATAVVIGVRSMPAEPLVIRADRPYFIVLRDRPTGAILFMGRIVDPR